MCVLENQPNTFGEFAYAYVSVSGKVVGLEMEFDITKLFVFSKANLTEDDVCFVSERNYDIVIYEGEAKFSSVMSKKTTVIAGFDADNVHSVFFDIENLSCFHCFTPPNILLCG